MKLGALDFLEKPFEDDRLIGMVETALAESSIWCGVTTHLTAKWIANQITEACGWEQLPRYLIRDRDGAYGSSDGFLSMGIRDQPTSPRSPWQNGNVERLIELIRRECLDDVVVLGECHLRHLLLPYMKYYNGAHASILGEGCAVLARRRTGWRDSLPSNSRRAAPPICPDLIFDRHRFGFGKIFKPIARRIAKKPINRRSVRKSLVDLPCAHAQRSNPKPPYLRKIKEAVCAGHTLLEPCNPQKEY